MGARWSCCITEDARRRLNGERVVEYQFGPWTIDDLFPVIEKWDLNLAGYRELPLCEEIEEWLASLDRSNWPLWLLIEQSCHDGELLDRDLRLTRISSFPLGAIVACEELIASVPPDFEKELLFMVHWSVRIERARRLGRP